MGNVDETSIEIILNNTVLSASVDCIHLLQDVLSGKGATVKQVKQEFQRGIALGHLPDVSIDWLPVLQLSESEREAFQHLCLRYGMGEASCLAVAQHRKLRLATDDRDARRYALRVGIPISGTIGILIDLIRIQSISLAEGNSILTQMRRKGYRSPVEDLSTLI